ncbi:MAG: hypothetical protein B7X62_05565 [Burkholderiales bacterium 39-55-53]|nr:MAG: hypothetical protein B7Y06_05550 [Burkholderiales bacterium 24-55-52]OZB00646.1 MAG: hypothetical protein B7X62_05565 [Burkholderiales bacterium 39-55-53]
MFTPEEIAAQEQYEFTKLRIDYPTIGEIWTRFQNRSSFQRPYTVSVLENIKGTFNYRELIVEVGATEACGTSVSYGQTLYLIRSANGTDEWGNHASVCNLKNENFAEEVKSALKRTK